MNNVYVFDIETFSNLFTLVGKHKDTGSYVKYAIYEDDRLGMAKDLFLFLYGDPSFIGYNSLDFDAQVLEEIWQKELTNAREIYAFAQRIIETKNKFELPYKPWTFSHKHLDLMALNNFGIYGKPTSLKWLEFTMRNQKIKDMPFQHFEELEEKHVSDVLSYNVDDVDSTFEFLQYNRQAIDMRKVLAKKYDDQLIINTPNSTIGEKIVMYSYCDYTGKTKESVKKLSTKRTKIVVKDIILDYINFKLPIFKQVKEDFENLILKANKDGVIILKGKYEKEIRFQNMDVKYALGGIHGCVSPGIYQSNDSHVIKTFDVTSMYPNIGIANKMYPEHLGIEFCEVYKNILEERKKYPKDVNLEMNSAYKEAANSVYGKSNAKNAGFLKDPEYTVKTTINGQLVLSMLGERLSEIGEFLMWNTDGSEILIPREKEDLYQSICDEWCELTGIELEHDEYKTMWIRDVNNYIAMFTSGKVKRKGMFCVYDDYIGHWSKNPSALIIPEAINAYFLEDKDVYETISNWNNIHDFLIGMKGGKNFEYWSVEINDNAIQNIERHKERAIRFYISTEGSSILKHWVDGTKKGDLPSAPPGTKGFKVKMLQNIPDKKGEIFKTVRNIIEPIVYSEPDENGRRKVIKKSVVDEVVESRYPDIDYKYYAMEAYKWINLIENKDEEE